MNDLETVTTEATHEWLECPECGTAGVLLIVPIGVNETVRAGGVLASEDFTPYCPSCQSAFSLALVRMPPKAQE